MSSLMSKSGKPLLLIGVGALGVLVWNIFSPLPHTHVPLISADCLKEFPLTSRTIDCDSYEESATRIKILNNKLNDAVALYISEGKAKRISVWARDLETKQWAAVNETERYTPASLLKLPLMIAYYKVAEIEPSILDGMLLYQKASSVSDNSQDIPSQSTLQLGQSYSVREMINDMIINSDNNAADALLNHLDDSIFEQTLIDLGIKIPGNDTNYDFLTAKTYANIFRILYNTSYLSREDSEKALELMSRSAYPGLTKGVGSGVKVAHKFGERQKVSMDGSIETRQLHDCGIVYKTPDPYSVCIMTEGSDWKTLEEVITDLSAIIYQNI